MKKSHEEPNKTNDNINASILSATDENIKICAEGLKNGEIIGMPTETVYGLAANAFNLDAVNKIFFYKGRPLSDPLIVHVTSLEMALSLTKIDKDTKILFSLLAEKFWPGPLTIVLKANFEILSTILTANTNYIGIRFPKNEIAQKLIDYSGVPIAAPSANKFCHVSPVNPLHVFEDFKEFPVTILDGGVCNFCMESTVVKILSETKVLQILRMGAISPDELQMYMKKSNQEYIVEIFKKNHEVLKQGEISLLNDIKLENEIQIDQESPGQFIKHYSPQLDTYIFEEKEEINNLNMNQFKPTEVIFIDYMHVLETRLKDKFSFPSENFLQLSITNNPNEVMLNIYDFLRTAEKFSGAKIIILCDLNKYMEDNEHKATLVDRVLKASAFKKINIK